MYLPGGQCVDQLNSYRCVCPYGLSGNNCDVIIDYCAASASAISAGGPCLNGATCASVSSPTPVSAHFVCRCPPGFRGSLCQIQRRRHGNLHGDADASGAVMVTMARAEKDETLRCAVTCLNGGTCIQQKISGAAYISKCICIGGYSGSDCSSRYQADTDNTSPPKHEHRVSSLLEPTINASIFGDVSVVNETISTANGNEQHPVGGSEPTIIIITAILASVVVSTVVIATALVTCLVRRRQVACGGDQATDRAPVDVITAPIARHCDVTRANNIAATSSSNDVEKWTPRGGLERRTSELPNDVRVKNVLFV